MLVYELIEKLREMPQCATVRASNAIGGKVCYYHPEVKEVRLCEYRESGSGLAYVGLYLYPRFEDDEQDEDEQEDLGEDEDGWEEEEEDEDEERG